MAAKRTRSQARRNGAGNGGMPGWAWLAIGLALGAGAFVLAPKFFDRGTEGFFRATPDTGAPPPAVDAASDDEPIVDENDAPDANADGSAKPQDYDFYTLLPGEETALSDRELAARARAEAAEREAEQPPSPPADPDAADAAVPPAIDAPAPPSAPAQPTAATIDTTAGDTKSSVDAANPRDDARYLLQAGAFAASGDAEALKAKIAFLGLSARVESARIKDKTVYRVRMGPYGSATELAEAKRKLAGNGLPAMAIKAK